MEARKEDRTICMELEGKFVNVKSNSVMTLIAAVKVVLYFEHLNISIFSLQIQSMK